MIVAIGSDEKGKQELDSRIFKKADLLVCDSRKQCTSYVELQHLKGDKEIFELGELVGKSVTGGLRVCDLTGMAAQDITAAKSFL